MNKNKIAAWVFVAVIAVIAIAIAPGVSNRINDWLGKDAGPAVTESQPAGSESAAPGQQASAPETGMEKPATATEPGKAPAATTATEARPTAKESAAQTQPAASGEETAPAGDMASVPENRAVEASQVPPVTIPTFGLLRVEPDGSTVIAGQAGANADIEILSGSKMIASAHAAPNGDFVAVLDTPLAPGDYELVLRATEANGDVAMSKETAIISVPEKGHEGELLALVEQPGEASRLINVPKPAEPGGNAGSRAAQSAEQPAPAAAPEGETPAAPQGTEVASAPAADAAKTTGEAGEKPADIRIEAVEIDAGTIFVAGAAKPGAQVRVYANEILLGDTTAGPNGRFLVEVKRDLPVGDYIIRADVIDPATGDVLARAAVPFTRSEGEHLSAVASDTPVAGETPPAAPGAAGGTAGEEQQSAALSVPESATVLPDGPPKVPEGITVTGHLRRTNSSVIIRRGDTLWHISRRVYGKGIRYTTIYLANQDQIKDPDMIWPGQIFALPEKSGG
jgi:nucleoid-associated protein YgaU